MFIPRGDVSILSIHNDEYNIVFGCGSTPRLDVIIIVHNMMLRFIVIRCKERKNIRDDEEDYPSKLQI